MVRIRFSNRYVKMRGVDLDNVSLKRLDVINLGIMGKKFIEDDCRCEDGSLYKGGNLGFEKGIMLLIEDKKGNGFVTIRSYSLRKHEYYLSKVGEKVVIDFS